MVEVMDRVARFFDLEYAGEADELAILEAYAKRTGGPLLELGCGTGRLLLPLAGAGYDVDGVDLSPAMLSIARAKSEAAGLSSRVHLLQGDFRDAPLRGPYEFAFCVMNTFLHLLSLADQLRALRHWRKHLAPRGLLLLDVLHPDVGQLANLDGRLEWDRTWTDPDTGATVMKWITRTVDLAEQTLHVTTLYDEVEPDDRLRRTIVPYDLRYLWRFEAELLLDKAGFRLEGVYGDWDLGPFDDESDRMILVAGCRG